MTSDHKLRGSDERSKEQSAPPQTEPELGPGPGASKPRAAPGGITEIRQGRCGAPAVPPLPDFRQVTYLYYSICKVDIIAMPVLGLLRTGDKSTKFMKYRVVYKTHTS